MHLKHLNISKLIAQLALGIALITATQLTLAGCELTFDPMTQMTGYMGHPCPQPRPGPSSQTESDDGMTTFVVTPEGHFPPQDPFAKPPGSNFLLTVYENLRDFNGDEMPNTLPSTPTNAYNLHDGPVLTKKINKRSPEDDLDHIIAKLEKHAEKHSNNNSEKLGKKKRRLIRKAINILEGNPIKDRAYSGFPVLHYNGPNKVKKVEPIKDSDGNIIGGNVEVNMIYFNQHIESDTAFVDPSEVQEVPWTVTYNVNILNRGMEDFSPMVMNFDRIGENRGPFHASMDQSYYPMLDEGTRYTVKIKETKGKYFNLVYTWGWRIHPPRVQVMENALKKAGPNGYTLPEWEKEAFCAGGAKDPDCNPMTNAEDKQYAIAQIGELSPAKRMWIILQDIKTDPKKFNTANIKALRMAFLDWTDRTKLPQGVSADPDANITLFYVNNTIYGSRQGLSGNSSKLGPASYKGIGNGSAHDWNIRPYHYKVTLLNGDHFPHGYMNVDFGGSRGWENQYQNTDPTTVLAQQSHPETDQPFNDDANIVAGEDQVFPINRGGIEEFLRSTPRSKDINASSQFGSGCFFTFGRHHAWPNAGGPWGAIMTMPVSENGTPGMHKVDITYNFEPSRRLRIYQFDPLHHDQAIYSLH